MHDLFHLFLQGNRSSTPSEASLDAPGEELPKVRTIHSADGSADAGKPSSRVRGLKNRASVSYTHLTLPTKRIV